MENMSLIGVDPLSFGDNDHRATPPLSPPPSPYSPQLETDRELATARSEIRSQIEACRTLIIVFELTRMRKSRMGSRTWFNFWGRLYDDDLALQVSHAVNDRLPQIAKLFYDTVQKLCALTREIERRVEAAESIDELERLWSEMGKRALAVCEQRRKRALEIFRDLVLELAELPCQISEADFDDMKRAIFGLDRHGNYHPGDPEAEKTDSEHQSFVLPFEREGDDVRTIDSLLDEYYDAVSELPIGRGEQELFPGYPDPMDALQEAVLRLDCSDFLRGY